MLWGPLHLAGDQCIRMSQSQVSGTFVQRREEGGDRSQEVDSDQRKRSILHIIGDEDCRRILDVSGEKALSANEISDACDLPLSTAYRKLEILTGAGLLSEQPRIRKSGKHPSEYVRTVESIGITFQKNGDLDLQVSLRQTG